MKHYFLTSFVLLSLNCCNSPTDKAKTISVKDTITIKKKNEKFLVAGEWRPFILGDINNDKISDTAFIYYPPYYGYSDTSITSDSMFEGFVDNFDYNRVRFSCKLPEFTIENSIWGFVEKTKDLDGDGINEIIFQTGWFIGTHVNIYIMSYYNGKWVRLAQNNRYEQDSYKNLITKVDNTKFRFRIEYFNEDQGDYINKTVTVKINKKL
ncbi:MAG: hypothetical protein H7321_05345 [Bacteroidia bacterium]|nr:hypothetical protein [Bacteroidia bacterium]